MGRRRAQQTKVPAASRRRLSASKKLLFATATTIVLFVGLEMVLWGVGVEPAYLREDPYQGFAAHLPHFVAWTGDDGMEWLEVAPSKQAVLNTAPFPRRKPADAYRIVCVGGSTVYGRPFFDQSSLAGWLRELLPAVDPSQRWEVINAGGISYASYRAAGIVDELCAYEPDLFVIYTGHNEFLERRTYAGLAEAPSGLTNAAAWASRTRTATLVRDALDVAGVARRSNPSSRPVVGDNVRSIPINSIGPEAYRRDEALEADVAQHFRATLERMIAAARRAGAEALLVTPAANLADFAPFKSEHRGGLAPADERAWNEAFQQAKLLVAARQFDAALDRIEAAERIDNRYAALSYLKGQTFAGLDRPDDARQAFAQARDEDVCPLRARGALIETVRDVAESTGATLVDFELLVEQHSDYGLPGSALFHDHVHLTIHANKLLALAIVDALAAEGIVRMSASWNDETIARVAENVESAVDRPRCAAELRKLASMLAWLDQPEQARRQAEASLAMSGRTAEALVDLGDLLLREGEADLAVDYFAEAVATAPDSAAAHCGLGAGWIAAGREVDGLAELRKAVALDSKSVDARTRLGAALAERGELEEAERLFAEIARDRPDLPLAHQNLGLAAARQGRLREAIAHYSRALALDPESSAAHLNAAAALEQLGEPAQARDHYREVLRLAPNHALAQSRLRALDGVTER